MTDETPDPHTLCVVTIPAGVVQADGSIRGTVTLRRTDDEDEPRVVGTFTPITDAQHQQ